MTTPPAKTPFVPRKAEPPKIIPPETFRDKIRKAPQRIVAGAKQFWTGTGDIARSTIGYHVLGNVVGAMFGVVTWGAAYASVMLFWPLAVLTVPFALAYTTAYIKASVLQAASIAKTSAPKILKAASGFGRKLARKARGLISPKISGLRIRLGGVGTWVKKTARKIRLPKVAVFRKKSAAEKPALPPAPVTGEAFDKNAPEASAGFAAAAGAEKSQAVPQRPSPPAP